MMSFGQQSAAANRKAALDQLKFKKKQKNTPEGTTHASQTSSWAIGQQSDNGIPIQSRDATMPSRFFAATTTTAGSVLVPSSSPPPSDYNSTYNPARYQSDVSDGIPGLTRSEHSHSQVNGYHHDALTSSSGFVSTSNHASYSWTLGRNDRRVSGLEGSGDDEFRSRVHRPMSPKDPLDLISTPDSPDVQRPGQRKRANGATAPSTSSDDSLPDIKDIIAGPSKPRILRGQRVEESKPSSTELPQTDSEDLQFTRFKLTQPTHEPHAIEAAWRQANCDVIKATGLLNDPTWSPPTPTRPPATQARVETGRVEEVDEATKAQRAAAREKGKKSRIYNHRPPTDSTVTRLPSPPRRSAIDLTSSPEKSVPPSRPAQSRIKRVKRKLVESDSEPEFVDKDDDEDDEMSSHIKRPKTVSSSETRTLEYFNKTSLEALQELTGCTAVQAAKIVELRPFASIDDLNSRLGQGKKKAGPAGISPRMVDDCSVILEGYGKVDRILAECEDIGTELKADIAKWTRGDSKGKSKSRDSPTPDIFDEGSLSLRSQAVLGGRKSNDYLDTQPSLLSKSVTLKEYQLLGVNWLYLLYRKRLSCILADEMGLGKTIQVISFFALLKERGCKGPHLVVVPSSTLENWVREFERFAPDVSVVTYYDGKNNRSALRQNLNDTQRKKIADGWEVLITTYNLAQGDERDRKFFKRISWDTCVFDEGHVLKNFQSQRYQALLKYESKWRLLLTGTPLQNNLQELVSLMNFILPEQFAEGIDSLRAVFKTKGDSKVTLLAQERVSRAKKMMTPFVLRRRKDQVLQDLPKKTERIEWCDMSPLQKTIYNDALQRSKKTIFDVENAAAIEEPPPTDAKPPKKKAKTNARGKDKLYLENSSNVLMDLRKASSHPMLFRRRFTDEALTSMAKLLLKEPDFRRRGALLQIVKEDMEVMTDAELQVFCGSYKSLVKFRLPDDCFLQAGKVKVLMELLKKYEDQGRKMLIFSQFTQILDILQLILDHRGTKYLVLTGATSVDVRQSLVDEFTEDESIPVFLLSTKAGGMGINLTAASVVIMFDQDFNPHNDKQAQDRAYRIGQKRDVEVIKLITKGSIEEDMLQLGQTKLALDEAVAGEDGGASDKVEREMKTSLMNVVRKKLVQVPDAEQVIPMDVTANEVDT